MNHLNVVDREAMSSRIEGAMACVTVLTPKPGKLEQLLELQLVQHRLLTGMFREIRGVRIYRALDGANIVSLCSFDAIDDYARLLESGIFIEHVDDIAPLTERTDRGYYQLEYEARNVGITSLKPDSGSVIWLNIVTTKPGRLDEFLRIQVAEQDFLRGSVAGVRGNRVYRSLNESKALMLASFEAPSDHQRWIQSDGFAAHVHKLLPLIERGDRGYYNAVYEAGEI